MNKVQLSPSVFHLVIVLFLLGGCTSTQFGKRTAYESYAANLKDVGLDKTILGTRWLEAGSRSLERPVAISLPYSEKGYFDEAIPGATGLGFSVKRGQRINFEMETRGVGNGKLFIEVWEANGTDRKMVKAHDSTIGNWYIEATRDQQYILRIQPELLQSISYSLAINTGPSLAFPVRKNDNPRVLSYWGADRDGGTRSHEGIDIFAKKGVPVVAIAPGVVTRVNENTLGGKVVFMRPAGKNYSLYYAHLDSQLVQEGQRVTTGDILGLMGNTGNARTTPAHLHFGIYSPDGAVDPYPFVNPTVTSAPTPGKDTSLINQQGRALKGARFLLPKDYTENSILSPDMPLRILAASGGSFRVMLADGREGSLNKTTIAVTPMKTLRTTSEVFLMASGDSSAAVKSVLPAGTTAEVLGIYAGYQLVKIKDQTGWIRL